MADGWAGTVLVVTVNEFAGPEPQSFEGITMILPDDVPTVTVMLFVFCPQ